MSNFSHYFKGNDALAYKDQKRPLSEKHLIDKYVEEVLLVIKEKFLRNYVPLGNIREEPTRNALIRWLGEYCYPFKFPLVIVRWLEGIRVAIVRAENPNDHLEVIRHIREWGGYFEIGYRLISYPTSGRPPLNQFYVWSVEDRRWINQLRNTDHFPPASTPVSPLEPPVVKGNNIIYLHDILFSRLKWNSNYYIV